MQNNGNDSLAGLYAKLAAIMGDMGNIPKDGTNTHFNYKFVTADAIADKVRTLLSQRSIAFFAAIVGKNLIEVRKGSEKTDPKTGEIVRMVAINMRWVVDFEFTFADGESGAVITRSWTAEADSGDDKGINKCATAAEKYFLLKTFVVTSADEPDAGGDHPRTRKQDPAQSRPTPPQPPASPASIAPTSTNGGSPDDEPLFTPPPATLEMPQIGHLNMTALLNDALAVKLVKHRKHFINLINLLKAEGTVRDAMDNGQVLTAIRAHEANKEAVS